MVCARVRVCAPVPTLALLLYIEALAYLLLHYALAGALALMLYTERALAPLLYCSNKSFCIYELLHL